MTPHDAAAGAQDQRQPQRDDQHVPVRGADGAPDDQPLEDQRQQRGGQHRHQERGEQRQPQQALSAPGHEGRDHQHLALGEVERAGGVVDDDQAQRHQRVDRAGGQPGHHHVNQRGGGHRRVSKRQASAPIAAHAVSTTDGAPASVTEASASSTPRMRWQTGVVDGPYASANGESADHHHHRLGGQALEGERAPADRRAGVHEPPDPVLARAGQRRAGLAAASPAAGGEALGGARAQRRLGRLLERGQRLGPDQQIARLPDRQRAGAVVGQRHAERAHRIARDQACDSQPSCKSTRTSRRVRSPRPR